VPADPSPSQVDALAEDAGLLGDAVHEVFLEHALHGKKIP
jgi:hypothetical protein